MGVAAIIAAIAASIIAASPGNHPIPPTVFVRSGVSAPDTRYAEAGCVEWVNDTCPGAAYIAFREDVMAALEAGPGDGAVGAYAYAAAERIAAHEVGHLFDLADDGRFNGSTVPYITAPDGDILCYVRGPAEHAACETARLRRLR